MTADLIVYFSCDEAAVKELEPKAEAMLRNLGFRFLNVAAFHRARSIQGGLPLDIEAIDAAERIVKVRSSFIPEGMTSRHTVLSWPGQSINVYTKPPTVHDSSLETALTSFAEAACAPTSVTRSTNTSAGSIEMHRRLVKGLRRDFTDAGRSE